MPCCHHCRASRVHLHFVKEHAGLEGSFEVVRCLVCGWQISRLLPWQNKARPFPIMELIDREEMEAKERLARVQKAAFCSFSFARAGVSGGRFAPLSYRRE